MAINGKLISEPYAVRDDPTIFPALASYRSRDQFGPLMVPEELLRGRVIHIFR